MLKAVIENMKLRSEFRFSKASRCVAILADDDRHLQFARDQQRFIAKLLRQARGIDQSNSV